MRKRPSKFGGFTLLELIVVMAILAIVAALAVPSLRAFTIGRSNSDTATQIVSLANFARAQAASEGRVYRLYFDSKTGEYWLAAQDAGVFVEPSSDYGQHFKVADGGALEINVLAQPNTQLNTPPDEQQTSTQLFGQISQSGSQPNTLLQNTHQNGQYIEFQPSGRTDPAQIRLTDRIGGQIGVVCITPTELFHIVNAEDLSR